MKEEEDSERIITGDNSKKYDLSLVTRLGLIRQRGKEFLQDFDFAIQMRLALWATQRRRKKGEHPQIF